MSKYTAGATSGNFTWKNGGTNPLFPSAPPIDAALTVKYAPGRTVISGTHDRMPRHEIWFLVDGWNEWTYAYGSTTYLPACLEGSIPGCRVDVN
uniref:hypothetical protein n=1 Tax=Cellulomonas sp. Y8 TaxID=2591145 RepID=UPI003D7148A0